MANPSKRKGDSAELGPEISLLLERLREAAEGLMRQMERGTAAVRDDAWYAARDVARAALSAGVQAELVRIVEEDLQRGAEQRCPICEGVDQPGLRHNPDAPYCPAGAEQKGKP